MPNPIAYIREINMFNSNSINSTLREGEEGHDSHWHYALIKTYIQSNLEHMTPFLNKW